MAIGTVDCTVEKKLCEEHSVRGYPTLKFALDGDVHDYPGGRKESDFVSFAEKLSRKSVQVVSSVRQAMDSLEPMTDEGVAFLAYHPKVVGGGNDVSVEEKLQRSPLTQAYGQVARKERAYGIFFLLEKKDDATGMDEQLKAKDKPFICRIESGVPPRCFGGGDDEKVDVDELQEFVKANNVATVTVLGAQNFHKVGRSGRPLVIGVIDFDQAEQVETASQELLRFAVEGPESVRDKYYYGMFDGKQFQKFLVQFDVSPDDLPQLLVLDVPTREYWQNSTYKLSVDDFMEAVQDGTMASKKSGPQGLAGILRSIQHVMVEYRPWSVVLAVLFLVAIGVLFLSILSPGDLRPPYRPGDIPPDPASTTKNGTEKPAVEPKKNK